MKILTKIFVCLALTHSLFAGSNVVDGILKQAIQSSAKEGWEYSANGGYVFKAQLDLIGDNKSEKLFWFSISDYQKIHIFDSSKEQKYLGELDRRLLGVPMLKKDEKTTLFTISDNGNYPNEGEEAFTKKVISTVISQNGIKTLERVAGVSPGRIDDKQFNSILSGSIEKEGFENFKPQVKFMSLHSYLNNEDRWEDFKQEDWVSIDSYLVHQDDAKHVRKIKSLSDENEIRELLGEFTKEKALQLLVSVDGISSKNSPREPKIRESNEIKPHVNSNTKPQESNEKREVSAKSNEGNYFIWIIAGALFLVIVLFLVQVSKKSNP